MSDRRERVARAFGDARESYIREALANAVCRGTDGDSYPNCVERIYELASLAGADAAMAAMDAEPTEAEIDAIHNYLKGVGYRFVWPNDIRAVIGAYRKVRQ